MSFQIGVVVGRLLVLLVVLAITVWCVRKVFRPGGVVGRALAALGAFLGGLALLSVAWTFVSAGASGGRKVVFVRPNVSAATIAKIDADYLEGWIRGFVGGLAQNAGYTTSAAPSGVVASADCDADCVRKVAAATNAAFVVTTELSGREGAYAGTLRINSASGEVVDSIPLAGKTWQFAVNPVRDNLKQMMTVFAPATTKH